MTKPDCPNCEATYVKKDTGVRIDPDTKEMLDTIDIFECTDCGMMFKEVEY